MRSLPRDDDQPVVGLRERKKAKTRAEIQRHALRLFQRQGYAATTVDQVAEAAEVAQSTVFRYFPTKEDLVLSDDYDDAVVAAFRAQPPELSPIEAFRRSVKDLFASLPPEEIELSKVRHDLVRDTPELRGAMLADLTRTIRLIAAEVALRLGRDPTEFAIRNLAGALIGVGMAALLSTEEDSGADYVALFDAGMAHLDAGLPL
jgi:AcrR family transcriptional regulator